MNEQLYYTFSSIGSGFAASERIRAQSPGVGSVNSEPVHALMRYLPYRLPIGASLQLPLDTAPISFTFARTEYHTILAQRVYASKEGVSNRPGNFFTHVILNPERVSPSNQIVPLSAQDAIRLWRSPLWLTDEDQIPTKGTSIDALLPREITRYIRSDWPFDVTPQEILDWLPTVFSAFLMLKKLNKKQLYLAAPADTVAAIIWCITRCLPRNLDIMQELTFSTYENDITNSSKTNHPLTIVGTYWLSPANHQSPFIPLSDPFLQYYRDQPSNPILAINCYNARKTQFIVEEQVQNFVDFAIQSLRTNNTEELDKLIERAEDTTIQDLDTFLARICILSEIPAETTIKRVLTKQELWPCLQFTSIREKLLEFFQEQRTHWQPWWETEGRKALQKISHYAKLNSLSEEARALNDLGKALLNELVTALATNQHTSKVEFWDRTFKEASSLESTPELWITLPERFARLTYTSAYQSWWEQSGKQIVHDLVISTTLGSQFTNEQRQLLQTNLQHWWNQSAQRLKEAWMHLSEAEAKFWVNQLSVLFPPRNDDSNWLTLLNELDCTRPQDKDPVSLCDWKTYITLMASWHKIGQTPSEAWLTIPWQNMPDLLAIPDSEFPVAWKHTALTIKVLSFEPPALIPQTLHFVARSTPLIHQVLAQLIPHDQQRQHAVTFCSFLLQHNYSQREQLLSTILPEIFPYEQEKQRLADAALLPHEQLNSYAETTIYNHLTTSQEIPAWFLPLLRVYLVHIRPKAMNPDRQSDQKQRQHISTILDILMKHDQQLLEDIYPSISFWHHINIFFQQQQSHFDAISLKHINNHINQIKLPKKTYIELQQELLFFLVNRISTETDLGRVIDHLQDALTPELSGYAPKTMAMYKEMTRLVGESTKKQDANRAKIIVYIKVTLNEAISLRNLKIPSQRIDQFVNECLTNLLSPLNESQIRDIQPTPYQWNESIIKLWEQYLHVYKTQHPLAKSYRLSPPPSSGRGGERPSAQPDLRATRILPIPPMQRRSEKAHIINNPTPTSPPPRDQIVLPAQNPTQHHPMAQPTDAPQSRNLAIKLTRLQQAFDSQQVDRIAAAYDEQLDPWLNHENQKRARIAHQIIATHEEGKKTGNWNDFIRLLNAYRREFKLSNEINETIKFLKGEQEK